MKQGNYKSFMRNGIVLTLALAMLCVLMPEWGAAQVVVVLLLALLAGFQWFLFFYLKP